MVVVGCVSSGIMIHLGSFEIKSPHSDVVISSSPPKVCSSEVGRLKIWEGLYRVPFQRIVGEKDLFLAPVFSFLFSEGSFV